MARPNIDERRKKMMQLIAQNGTGRLTREQRHEIAREFDTPYNAIYSDEINIAVDKLGKGTFYASKSLRAKIYNRDGKVCQYCGSTSAKSYEIEHVIPTTLGGIAEEYNLVIACVNCNSVKRSNVWIPTNIETIRYINAEWADLIVRMAS